jgi:hypothetical protein
MTTAHGRGSIGRAALIALSFLATSAFLATPADAASDPRDMSACQQNSFCWWPQKNFEGKMQTAKINSDSQDIQGDLGERASSYYNNSAHTVELLCDTQLIELAPKDTIESMECKTGQYVIVTSGSLPGPFLPPTGEGSTGDPSTGEMPIVDPSTGEMPAVDPSIGESPVRDPSIGESPLRDPSIGELPQRDPSADETPLRDPSAGESPLRDPAADEPTLRDPSIGESPVGEPPVGDQLLGW